MKNEYNSVSIRVVVVMKVVITSVLIRDDDQFQ